MTEILKNENDWDCRALSDGFLSRFDSDDMSSSRASIGLKAFVNLVIKNDELEFCLRGNDYSKDDPLSGRLMVMNTSKRKERSRYIFTEIV